MKEHNDHHWPLWVQPRTKQLFHTMQPVETDVDLETQWGITDPWLFVILNYIVRAKRLIIWCNLHILPCVILGRLYAWRRHTWRFPGHIVKIRKPTVRVSLRFLCGMHGGTHSCWQQAQGDFARIAGQSDSDSWWWATSCRPGSIEITKSMLPIETPLEVHPWKPMRSRKTLRHRIFDCKKMHAHQILQLYSLLSVWGWPST